MKVNSNTHLSASISRRQVLQIAAAGSFGAAIIGTTSKSGNARPIVGDAEHKYEVYHDWGELPDNIRFGNTHGICVDSEGNIHIAHTVHWTSESDDSIVVFDSKGKFVRSWGQQFKNGAHGLHLEKEGKEEFLYICDTKRRVVIKTTLSGEEVLVLGYPKESPMYGGTVGGKPSIKYIPTNVAISPKGDIYVADGYGSSHILQYDSKGTLIRTFGNTGTGPGELKQPHGIWCDQRGSTPIIVVADRGNKRIQSFTLNGEHIGVFGGTNLPCHFHQYQGTVVVPDLGARVTLLNRKNEVVVHLGDDSQSNWQETRLLARQRFAPGKFICPHSACFDHEGNIFVVEFVEIGRVTKLRHVS
jgi:hypothetical protein